MTRKYFWFGLLILGGLGAAVYWSTTREHGPAIGPAAAAAIPVIATDAQLERVSDYLVGLGSVQAFNRVTVHVRVDGELQAINFTEGQNVREGDVLAKIDPRLFQATLDQAKAKKPRTKPS
jgi:membrane fusion protein, multidrug efflux system